MFYYLHHQIVVKYILGYFNALPPKKAQQDRQSEEAAIHLIHH